MNGLISLYKSVMGTTVESPIIMKALELMLYGMAGIFVVMILIFVVIAVLNRVSKPKDGQKNKE